MLNPIEGEIFCIDKPLRMTSFAAVKKIRAVLRTPLGTRQVKVGHAGTLDPLATGVLMLCTGHATKRIDELQAGIKEYIADLRLGATTPSYDLETQVDATFEWRHIDRALIDRVLQEQFTGSIEQVPPSFSACKIDGKPAYKLARKGQDVEIRPKTLVIDETARGVQQGHLYQGTSPRYRSCTRQRRPSDGPATHTRRQRHHRPVPHPRPAGGQTR